MAEFSFIRHWKNSRILLGLQNRKKMFRKLSMFEIFTVGKRGIDFWIGGIDLKDKMVR